MTWTLDDLTDLTGATAVITGGTRGVGLATTTLLRDRGAVVLTGSRSCSDRYDDDRDHHAPDHRLDLADPASIMAFAAWVREHADHVDVLVNNAGISNQPFVLAMGIESQLAVNHLGHFLLTDELLPLLTENGAGRVVTVTSAMWPMGTLDLATTADEEGYTPGGGYVCSKLANVLFADELGRRTGVRSLLAHPGLANTSMHDTYPDAATTAMVREALAHQGRDAIPAATAIVYAATSSEAVPGVLYGPEGSRERPYAAGVLLEGADPEPAGQLWEDSAARITAQRDLLV